MWEIRKANINDIEAVTAIYNRIYKMEAEGLVRIGWNPSIYPVRATAEEALQRGDLFVYEQDGTIMASAIINRTQVPVYATGQWAFPANDDEVMVLHTLTVDPVCGGRGIGRQFVAFYEDYALREGCSILRLDTNAVNSIDYTADADIGIDDVAEDAVGDMLKDVGTQHRHDEDTEAEARGRNTGS